MSVGAITQAVNFQNTELTIVLGNNLDLGGDGNRNGVGKTALMNALSYALYGKAISNIRQSNLINKTNGKGMFVALELEINGKMCRIERGRSPNILRFMVDESNIENEETENQGENRLTQQEIEKMLGLNHLMFKHLVVLNTYNEPFLSLGPSNQREIIENLLGITLLSEKAAILKELLKDTKDGIKEEEYKIKGIENANQQIEKSINDLKRRQRIWQQKKNDSINDLTEQINYLEKLDIEKEIELHSELDEYLKSKAELSEITQAIKSLKATIDNEIKNKEKAESDLENAKNHKCYACGQSIHDEQHKKIVTVKENDINEANKNINDNQQAIVELEEAASSIVLPEKIPTPKYKTAQEAYEKKGQLTNFKDKLKTVKNTEDPYIEQITQLEENGLQEISWDKINELHNLKEHQDFLLKLLTSKDSFVRKKIIEQNLQYLNSRLNYYLVKLGLPHEVVFMSDLNVSIQELGRELDFDNLSRGERNRLVLGVSWAFRDVFESLNSPIDFLAIDEIIDSGMDSAGMDSALSVLKNMARSLNKNIFLISHREELISRVNNILYVSKENGFTSLNQNSFAD